MNDSSSKRRQINTELAIRGTNEHLRDVIEKHTPPKEHRNLKIDFFCECSDPACHERLSLTLAEYDKLHNSGAHFVIAKGHKSPAVEKVVKTKYDLQVVEKYAL